MQKRRKLTLKASEDDKATDTFIKRIKLLSTPNGLYGNYVRTGFVAEV